MPSKSKRTIRNGHRQAALGGGELENGHITPRAVRFGIAQGKYVMQDGRPPVPPPEWREWKRERFTLSIKAAHLFLRGREIEEIGPLVGKGKVGTDVTKQRISQMVSEGVKFFLDRRFVSGT